MLTKSDYLDILSEYNMKPIYKNTTYKRNKSKKTIDFEKTKKKVHKILSKKLCTCIKSVKNTNRYAICNKSVFHQKGISNYGFKCKNEPKLLPKKKTKKYLKKIPRKKHKLTKKRN